MAVTSMRTHALAASAILAVLGMPMATLAERVDLLRALGVVVTIDRQARGPRIDLDSIGVAFGADDEDAAGVA